MPCANCNKTKLKTKSSTIGTRSASPTKYYTGMSGFGKPSVKIKFGGKSK